MRRHTINVYESTREAAAKVVANHRGHYGKPGGWIYDENDRPICQGWAAYADRVDNRGLLRTARRPLVRKGDRWAIDWSALR